MIKNDKNVKIIDFFDKIDKNHEIIEIYHNYAINHKKTSAIKPFPKIQIQQAEKV